MVDGFVTCRLLATAVVFVRFFGLGIGSAVVGAFSWSTLDISSLKMDHQLRMFIFMDGSTTHLFRFNTRTGWTAAAILCSWTMALTGGIVLGAALFLIDLTALPVVVVLLFSCAGLALSIYLASSSPILAFRRDIGMRLTRNSRRVRRL